MHNLLRTLGRGIVCAESIYNPGKRRFLVDAKDISDVVKDNTGRDNVLSIYCNTSEIKEPLSMDKKSFKQMHNLQFMKFYKRWWPRTTGVVKLNLPQGLVYLPRKLRLLYWDEYPAKYTPSSFRAEHLVELIMKESKLEKLWEGNQPLRSLKKINLSGSKDLKDIPDLSKAKNLNMMCLNHCTSLVTLPSSIRNLNNLIDLWMYGCTTLEVFPTDVNLESLEFVDLGECSRLRSFPRISRNISRLYLDGTAMEDEDYFWIENLLGLTKLDWVKCPLRYMPSNFHSENLVLLEMRDSKLEKLWTGVKSLERLELVNLSGSINLEEIPDLLTSLKRLYLNNCKSLEMLPSSIQNLDKLERWNMRGCESLKEIPNLPKTTNLETLKLDNCKSLVMLPSSIQNLDKLTVLDMRACTSVEVLPTNINLVSLTTIYLGGCSRLTSFPQLSTRIQNLNLSDNAIQEVPPWIKNIVWLTELRMRRCEKLRIISANIWNLEYLKGVDFTECGGVTSVSDANEEMYLFRSNSNTKFLFRNWFKLDRDAQEFVLQSVSEYVVLPGKKVPTYVTHRTYGSYLLVPLPQSSLSQLWLGFKACIIPGPETDFLDLDPRIIVHWKFKSVNDGIKVELDMDSCKIDHMVFFHFDIFFREEINDPLSQLDCNNVEFEFELHFTTVVGNTKVFFIFTS